MIDIDTIENTSLDSSHRIQKFDLKNRKNLSESQQKEQEGELILKQLQNIDQLILLDENGKDFSSRKFAQFLQ